MTTALICWPWSTRSERELTMETLLRERDVELRMARLEVEELALVNENLRRWILALTACATQAGRSLGVPEGK
jgi:hypothetical protein